ncbi:hypothetical protein J7L67_10175, partial [bacterium]|nr:hypothetical protein [bacterium]
FMFSKYVPNQSIGNLFFNNKIIIVLLLICCFHETSVNAKVYLNKYMKRDTPACDGQDYICEKYQQVVPQKNTRSTSQLTNIINDIVKSATTIQKTDIERFREYKNLIKSIFFGKKYWDSQQTNISILLCEPTNIHTQIHNLNYDDILTKYVFKENNILRVKRNKNFICKFGNNLQEKSSTGEENNIYRSSFITFFDQGKFVTKRFTVPFAYIKEPEKFTDIYWETYNSSFSLKDILPPLKYKYLQMHSDSIPILFKKNITADFAYIGNHGTGKLCQQKGTHTIKGSFYLGFYPDNSGLFLLSDGYFYADQIVLGLNGSGKIFQLSGSVNVETVLYLGLNSSSESMYTLAGGLLKSDALIGIKGTGKFLHAYGLFNSNWISVGFSEGAGIYKMRSGELNSYMLSVGHGANIWNSQKKEFTGWKSGKGLFDQSGGTANIDTLSIGVWHSQGTYILRDTAVLNSYFVYIGNNNGKGEFIHKSGIHKSKTINIGHLGGIGVYEMDSGRLQAEAIVIGNFTNPSIKNVNGYFIQNGGIIENERDEGILWLTLGYKSGKGKYLMKSGRLHAKTTHIGFSGSGIFTHKGGDHFSEYFDLGYQNGEGVYILSGGHLRSYRQYMGNGGSGIFLHYKGTNFTDQLYIACGENGYGIYELFDGELVAGLIQIGCKKGRGLLDIKTAHAKLIVQNGYINFEKTAEFKAVKGATIILKNASFISQTTDEAVCAGVKNINLSFESGNNKIELFNQSSNKRSFLINSVEIKNNGTELALNRLTNIELKIKYLIVNENTSFNLNGNTVYCEELKNNGGKINLNGGKLIYKH